MKTLTIILILFSASASGQDTTFYRVMKYTYIGLNVADYVLTQNALKKGAVEANPIIDSYFRDPYRMAALKISATAGVILLTDKIYEQNPKMATITMIGMNLLYGAIVTNNVIISARFSLN